MKSQPVSFPPDAARYLCIPSATLLVCDGGTVRAYGNAGRELPECVQYIPAGWHPPLVLELPPPDREPEQVQPDKKPRDHGGSE